MRVYASKPNSKGIYDISAARDSDRRPGAGKLVGSACKARVDGRDGFEFRPSERFSTGLDEIAGQYPTMRELTASVKEALERQGYRPR